MPCYYDTPDEDDQKEIEKRCKVRMYLDSVDAIDSVEQRDEARKNNIKLLPGFDDEQASSMGRPPHSQHS